MKTPFCVQRYCLKVLSDQVTQHLSRTLNTEEEKFYHISVTKMYLCKEKSLKKKRNKKLQE